MLRRAAYGTLPFFTAGIGPRRDTVKRVGGTSYGPEGVFPMRRSKTFVCLLALAMILLLCGIGETAEQPAPTAAQNPSPPKTAPAQPPEQAIPLSDVPGQAAAVMDQLSKLSALLAPNPAVQAIVTELPDLSENIGMDLATLPAFLEGEPSLATLSWREQPWNARQVQTTAWLSLLTQEVSKAQDALNQLAGLKKTWTETRAAAQAAKASGAVLQQIDSVLVAIQSTDAPFQSRHTTLVSLQARTAQELTRCTEALTRLTRAQQQAMTGILARDSRPIWSASQWGQARTTLQSRIDALRVEYRKGLIHYLENTPGLLKDFGVFILVVLLMLLVRRRVEKSTAAGETLSPATAVLKRPYAVALLFPLLYISSTYSTAPTVLKDLARVLALLPVLRLTRAVLDPFFAAALYAQVILFALDTLRLGYAGSLGPEQALLAFEMAAGIAVISYSLIAFRWRRHPWLTERRRPFRIVAACVIAVLGIGIIANVLGYLRLARLLASTVLGSGALALSLYASLLVLMGVTAVALRAWPLRLLGMVQHHRDLLESRTHTVLSWLVVLGWVGRLLDYVGFLQPTVASVTAVLTARLHRGSMSISLGDVLEFLLTLWVAYLVSAFLRFVLEEDVYPHLSLPRGISYALSSLLNYSIVALGFLLGLSALGLDLTKLTVLAGAFGVGIGFGMQNVVNNFVSGLILLFERPIHVGDAIQAGDLTGEVRRIGIRASIVRTWDGADMIVPNGQLITDRVINWTLRDRLRRISIPVGVNYGASPKKVIELLETVARQHPDILSNPPSQAFFTEFGESSLNFELRAWTEQFDRWFQIRSDLATAIYEAGVAAGLSFPFPQREVRILPDTWEGTMHPKEVGP